MKILKTLPALLLAATLFSCNTQSPQQENNTTVAENGDLQVYYFHFSKRCATCNAIEAETKVALETFYANQVKEGDVAFISVNLDEEDGKKMGEQLDVSGQTLLLVKGDQRVNLTNEGFMNARTNAGKFHEILKSNIDPML